ncbi:MAG: hypothetical protein IIV10_05910 [Alistipes sp.]|nr:hypothetical protein [Alistipes sp.]
MKRFLLIVAALFCVTTVSAQSKVKEAANYVASQKWSVGLRVAYGVQVEAECFYSDKAYVEGRIGILNGPIADFAVLHNWNCCTWDWTPKAGQWFLDLGVGANLGGAAHFCYGGVVGQCKFGIKFNKVPIRLAIDYSPAINIGGWYGKGVDNVCGLYIPNLYNTAISATYCF